MQGDRQNEHPPKLKDLAETAGMSPYHFHRLFKDLVGVTPKKYASSHQACRFQESLKTSESITDRNLYCRFLIEQWCLFQEPGPSGNETRRISSWRGWRHSALWTCRVRIWLAYCGRHRPWGVCNRVGDDPALLPQQVQDRFPQAHLQKASTDFVTLIREVVRLINTPNSSCTLPLDIQGALQQQVWDVLRQINPGETLSYAEVARKVGNPKAVRAVASACAAGKQACRNDSMSQGHIQRRQTWWLSLGRGKEKTIARQRKRRSLIRNGFTVTHFQREK